MVRHFTSRLVCLFLLLISFAGHASTRKTFATDQQDQEQLDWVAWMNNLLNNPDHADWPSIEKGWSASAAYHVLYINDRGRIQSGLGGRSYVTAKGDVNLSNSDATDEADENKVRLMLAILQSLLTSGEPLSFTYEQSYGQQRAPGFSFKIQGKDLPGQIWSIHSSSGNEIAKTSYVIVKVVIDFWDGYYIKSLQFNAA